MSFSIYDDFISINVFNIQKYHVINVFRCVELSYVEHLSIYESFVLTDIV